jgi:predicted transcriptional regulator
MDIPKDTRKMLEPLLGSKSAEKVLIFIEARDEGYAREISRFFTIALNPVQKQVDKLEMGGVLVSFSKGRT